MKKLIALIINLAIILSAFTLAAFAISQSETIDINGVEVRCGVSDGGILQILLTQEQQEQITESFWNGDKRIEGSLAIDLTGVGGLNGFAFGFYPELSFVVEFMKDVKLFVSPSAAMGIGEMSGREYVVLEAVYSFSEDNYISGVELKTANASGREIIHTSGVICFPLDSGSTGMSDFALERDGETIVLSEVQDGLFYSTLSLTGKYSLVEVTPMAFDDEIPLWAKSTTDWMSARNVVLGRDGSFCPDDGITRAEFLTMFERLSNIRENSDMAYYVPPEYEDATDIPDWSLISPSFPELFLGVEQDGFLYPNQIMTRGEILIMLRNYVLFADLYYEPSPEYEMSFTDEDAFTQDQSGAAWLVSRLGILEGFDDGSARMDETATRAQAAELLCKFAQWQILNRTYR